MLHKEFKLGLFWLIGFSVVLSGCTNLSSNQTSQVIFDEVIVYNDRDRPIKDFKVINTMTHRYFGCSIILPDSTCSIAFSKRSGQKHPVKIAWVAKGKAIEETLQTEFIANERITKKVYIHLLPDGKFTSVLR